MEELDKLLECVDLELSLAEALAELSDVEERTISEIQSFNFLPSLEKE